MELDTLFVNAVVAENGLIFSNTALFRCKCTTFFVNKECFP